MRQGLIIAGVVIATGCSSSYVPPDPLYWTGKDERPELTHPFFDAHPELRDLALTTNGSLLVKQARELARAGLQRVTVSLDSHEEAIFRETGTLGVRWHMVERAALRRSIERVSTPWGEVNVKVGWYERRATSVEPEFEDCRQLAEEHGVPVADVMRAARAAARPDGA